MDTVCSSDVSGLATPVSDCGPQHTVPIPCPVPALLVTNLPSVLFSQVADLHPLLCPFGEIVSLKIASENTDEGTVSVLVEYKTTSQAKEAFDALCGQRYTSKPVNVQLVYPTPSPTTDSGLDYWSSGGFGGKAGLNPLAAPFLAERTYPVRPPVSSLPYYAANLSRGDNISIANIVTRTNSPFLDPSGYRSSMSATAGLYGLPLVTHRPHSAPSESVLQLHAHNTVLISFIAQLDFILETSLVR